MPLSSEDHVPLLGAMVEVIAGLLDRVTVNGLFLCFSRTWRRRV